MEYITDIILGSATSPSVVIEGIMQMYHLDSLPNLDLFYWITEIQGYIDFNFVPLVYDVAGMCGAKVFNQTIGFIDANSMCVAALEVINTNIHPYHTYIHPLDYKPN
jgi:hypothetical protein